MGLGTGVKGGLRKHNIGKRANLRGSYGCEVGVIIRVSKGNGMVKVR